MTIPMPKPTIDEILLPKPDGRLRIYAWTPNDPPPAYAGLIKVGQTTQADVNDRIRQSQGQMQQAYTLHVDEVAERADGSAFRDSDVRRRLIEKGFENVTIGSSREWMRCSPADVQSAIIELQEGLSFQSARNETFPMRREQAEAVEATYDYYQSRWAEDPKAVPRFLWNAKMRFGKTFTGYQLAKKLDAKRVLVVTFKPAVEDAWEADLNNHVDFEGWKYLSRNAEGDPLAVPKDTPLVYFGSFQDLLGKDRYGNIKARNESIHVINWDLVIFDEYHFGAWRESATSLFEDEEKAVERVESLLEGGKVSETKLAEQTADLQQPLESEADFLPITSRAFLYLSGTPFKALATGEFIEEQIFNWTYTDEQRAKATFAAERPAERNPYAALPQMQLLTYQMPDELLAIASGGEFDEFDLNEFFKARTKGVISEFEHKDEVQRWLDIIRGQDLAESYVSLKTHASPPWPYSNGQLLPWLQHSFWFLPSVAACYAMRDLLSARHNVFWHDYNVIVAAGPNAGMGPDALLPVRRAIGSGYQTKTITLSCGKLTTGVTVPQWSSILMLRNLKSPETYFQAAFRVQSPFSIKNPEGDDPNREDVLKPVCFVFDFAPTRALRQITDYGIGLSPSEPNPEKAVADLVSFLPVLAFDGSVMVQADVDFILDYATAGTTGTLLARKWESAMLVNVDNDTLRRVLASAEAMAAVERIEGWSALGNNVIETIVNKSEKIKDLKKKAKEADLSEKEKKELTKEEKAYKSLRKKVQDKLIKFATRIPAFMYLTDFRENTLVDVITKIEPDLFRTVTGLTVGDFNLLVDLKVFNTERMNAAVFAFRRYEDASLRYTGIDTHEGLTRIGGYNTVVARESAR
ncbi:DEAD/DEAH box helicase family protein [Porphyrobacter sp. CACIAM 03H1]|uniref:DEAD/DEAH box helicase family protein n=1 Tax=Porphyrobacter sp. CACIAM 03H1 TaxID=2003315 RepID=UPI001F2A5AAC|nr:DEAD/DEAH box helicase family protein [Porphyrobacter sp. CACIAM 03H1]